MLVILILEEVPGCENGSTSVLLLSSEAEDLDDETVEPLLVREDVPVDVDEEDEFLLLFP